MILRTKRSGRLVRAGTRHGKEGTSMRSNRTIQTILQSIILVLLAAIVFQLPSLARSMSAGGGGGRYAPRPPNEAEIKKAFRAYFEEWKKGELPNKADIKGVDVKDLSVNGSVAHAKLRIEVKWKAGHNMEYTEGPLKNAPGVSGEAYVYEEIFPLRFWTSRGWDFEGHLPPPEIRQ
jgi:hypothetical protein